MEKFNTQQRRLVRYLALVLIGLLFAACSAIRLTYNHGDTLLYWWLDAYVDFDSDQKAWVKHDIDNFFQWHRKTQLHDYVQLLATGQHQLAGNLSQADLMSDLRDIKGRSELLLYTALPQLADLARSIRPEQLVQMEKKFAQNNDDYRRKFMRGDTERRQKARFQKSLDEYELWFGSFSREQEDRLRKMSDARPLDNDVWLDERIRRQKQILAVLHKVQQEKLSKDATMVQIHNLIRDTFDRLESPERKAFYDAYIDQTCQMILAVVKMATPAQKAHVLKRMQGWMDDFNSLAAEAK